MRFVISSAAWNSLLAPGAFQCDGALVPFLLLMCGSSLPLKCWFVPPSAIIKRLKVISWDERAVLLNIRITPAGGCAQLGQQVTW